jgi:hypothetical protein
MQKFSNEMIAQANALEAEGISTRRTVERLRAMYPDEPIPSHKSVAEWRKELHGRLHEELEDNELVIARRADELVVKKLDWSEEHMDKARLAELVMAAGVYRDKPMKRATLNSPTIQAQNITINFISQPKPDIIEGEVVESD